MSTLPETSTKKSYQYFRVVLTLCSCSNVRYSSKAAQRAAWRSHKQECAALARVAPRVPPATVRLAARVLWRAERWAHHLVASPSIAAHVKMWCPVCWQPDDMISFDSEAQGGQLPAEEAARGRLGGGTFAEVQQLEHHWDELSDERKTTFAQMAMLTRSVRHHILLVYRPCTRSQPLLAACCRLATRVPVLCNALTRLCAEPGCTCKSPNVHVETPNLLLAPCTGCTCTAR